MNQEFEVECSLLNLFGDCEVYSKGMFDFTPYVGGSSSRYRRHDRGLLDIHGGQLDDDDDNFDYDDWRLIWYDQCTSKLCFVGFCLVPSEPITPK